ncbi:MAG: M20/M25/M40 family metallo-hydrolase [Bryobacteraceae bacterium]|jgi:acetylornithine deacetylase/succinyl-diaminopimelate desuccinylase-like protein
MGVLRGFALALCCGLLTAQAGDLRVNWPAVQPELLDYYRALLRIDTSNPPGNETRAVNYLRQVLDREHIPYQVFTLAPHRANLVARLKGNGSKRPVLLMGHTDVVGVERDKWRVDPFAAILRDGWILGRGSIDDKSHVAVSLMTVVLLHRMRVPLDRDVIFLAEAGEEGATQWGIDFLVRQHWDNIAAEFALAEGGQVTVRGSTVRYVEITTTEKVVRPVRLIAHGTSGHGSQPRLDNPIVHLANAVSRLSRWQPPMRLNATTRAWFEGLAKISAPDDAFRYAHIGDPEPSASIQRYLAEHEVANYAVLRTSIAPTVIRGGFRSNVIPSEAEAVLDIRALPDEDLAQLWAELRRIIADPSIEVKPVETATRPAAPPSRIDTEMFRALERAQRKLFPGSVTLPAMATGATDLAQLRAKGVQGYGYGPEMDELTRVSGGGPHSDDERLREDSLYKMAEFLWLALTEVAASKPESSLRP